MNTCSLFRTQDAHKVSIVPPKDDHAYNMLQAAPFTDCQTTSLYCRRKPEPKYENYLTELERLNDEYCITPNSNEPNAPRSPRQTVIEYENHLAEWEQLSDICYAADVGCIDETQNLINRQLELMQQCVPPVVSSFIELCNSSCSQVS